MLIPVSFDRVEVVNQNRHNATRTDASGGISNRGDWDFNL